MSRSLERTPLRAGLCALILTLAATGCASSGGGGSRGGNPDLITREEILEQAQGSVFTVVERLRPRWLRARTQGSFSNPNPAYAEVFVDQQHFGPIEVLGTIPLTDVESIEFIDATDATTRYGTGYAGGIIRINTRRGG